MPRSRVVEIAHKMSRKLKRAVIVLGLIALVVVPGCKDEPAPAPSPRAEKPSVAFRAGEVRGIDAHDRPEAQSRAQEEAAKVIELLNQIYLNAFVDPALWKGGTHPQLAGFFTQEAQAGVAPNLSALSLAELAGEVKRVKPTRAEASKITLLIEEGLDVAFGSASIVFEARGEAKARKAGNINFVQTANFFLMKEGDAYKVYAFTANLKADSVTKAAAFGIPRSEPAL